MAEIALYDTLRKIPEVSDAEAKEAVADVANSKEIVTKADLKAEMAKVDKTIAELKGELLAEMYRLNNRTIMWMVGIGLAIIGVIKYL